MLNDMEKGYSRRKYKELLPEYLNGLCNGKYTLKQAAQSTGYTMQWLSVLKKKFKKYGSCCLVHGNKGRVPSNKISDEVKSKIVDRYKSEYKDINFNYYRGLLRKYEGINVSYGSLYSIMTSHVIMSPEARKVSRKRIHKPRERRRNEGDLLQLDGTPFQWFYRFGNKKKYCLQGAIDDATGKITALYMTENECLYGYMELMRETVRRFGVPREVYVDRAAIFCCPSKGGRRKCLSTLEQDDMLHQERTQWQRILGELGVRQILAYSPQAKGRVERMWYTLQGRLPYEFYRNRIMTMEQANVFLQNYIEAFNKEFAVLPEAGNSFYRKVFVDLDDILCVKVPRKTNHSGVLSFHKHKFLVEMDGCADRNVLLCISERGVYAEADGYYYPIRLVEERPSCISVVLKNIIDRYMLQDGKRISA